MKMATPYIFYFDILTFPRKKKYLEQKYWVKNKKSLSSLHLRDLETVTKKMTLAQKFANNKKIYNFDIIVMKLCQND